MELIPEVLRYAVSTRLGDGSSPVGVVLGAACLKDSELVAIAEAIGCGETAFLSPVPDGDETAPHQRVRFFDPCREVDFGDLAAIGAAVALAERGGPGEIVLDTPTGAVTVHVVRNEGLTVSTFTSPHGTRVTATAARLALSPYDDLDQL